MRKSYFHVSFLVQQELFKASAFNSIAPCKILFFADVTINELKTVVISREGSRGLHPLFENAVYFGWLSPPKSFALILSFKGYVHKTLTTLNRQVLFCLFYHLNIMNFVLLRDY